MRIGYISAEFPPDVGGVGDHTARLGAELATRGHAVDVVTSTERPSPPDPLRHQGGGGAEDHHPAADRFPSPHRPLTRAPGEGPGVRGNPAAQEAERHPLLQPPHTAAVPDSLARVVTLRVVRRWDWRVLGLVARLASERGWDVLHIQYQTGAYALHPAINVLPFWLRMRAQRRRRPAIVTTFHDLREPYIFPKAGPLRRLAVARMARDSDLAIVVAEGDLAGLAASPAAAGASARARALDVRHVPLGNHFEGVPPGFDRAEWRRRLRLPPGADLVGHLGFVNRSKAVDELVRAMALLAARGRETHLLLIGEPLGTADATNRAYLEEVRQLVEHLRLGSRVHWTGLQQPEEIGAWLRCLDVAALPFRDGASARRTSLIAAWSHGVPVVTTVPVHWPAWSESDPPAATVRALSGEALAAALAALLDNPEQRQRLRAAGTSMAQRFSWPLVAEQTLDVYEAAVLLRRP